MCLRRFLRIALTLLLILPATAQAQHRAADHAPPAGATANQIATLAQQLAVAQSAIQATADQLRQLGAQIGNLQKQVDALPKTPPLTPQQADTLSQLAARTHELDTTSEELAKAASELAKADLDARRDLVEQLLEIFGIAAALGGGGFAVFEYFRRRFVQETRKELEETIRKPILAESLVTTGGTFAQVCVPWWEQYEPALVIHLRAAYLAGALPASPVPFLREIVFARRLAEEGFLFLDNVWPSVADTEEAIQNTASLCNHWVYHRTAELLCAGTPISALDRSAVMGRTEQCLRLSENPKAAALWYNLRQTAAFAFLNLGDDRFNPASPDQQLVVRGRQLLVDLLQGRTPLPPAQFRRPSLSWLQGVYDEVCPVDPATGASVDVFMLGVPRPA